MAGLLTIRLIAILVTPRISCHISRGAVGVGKLVRAKRLITVLSLEATQANPDCGFNIYKWERGLGRQNLNLEVKSGLTSLVGPAADAMSGDRCEVTLLPDYRNGL